MRDDMTKIFHEPGRNGGSRGSGRGSKRNKRAIADGVNFEPMRRDRDRERSSSYAPLRHYLLSQVGRPWNEVFSDITHSTRSTSLTAQEVREAVDDMVEKCVHLIDSVPHDERGYAITYRGWSPVWVHPETGLLMRSPEMPRRRSTRKPTFEQIDIDASSKLVKIENLWFVVSFEPLPSALNPDEPERDIVLKLPASNGYTGWRGVSGTFRREWGGNVYAVSKRAANKKEIKQFVKSAS
jgi:hypothetical protein